MSSCSRLAVYLYLFVVEARRSWVLYRGWVLARNEMSGVMIYPIPSMSQCECDCPWDATVCFIRATALDPL